jgi:hypothetical protein
VHWKLWALGLLVFLGGGVLLAVSTALGLAVMVAGVVLVVAGGGGGGGLGG